MTIRAWLTRAAALAGAASLLSGCWLFGQYEEMKQADLHFRNEGVRVNLRTVALALQMYARDHRGLYPMKNSWLSELTRSYYLPNSRLPPNPWSIMDEHTQGNVVPLGALPAMTGDGPFDPAPPGTVLGKGARPSSPLYTSATYGALLYDVAPGRRMCVLYGVGQQGEDAVLVDSQVRGRPYEPTPMPTAVPTPEPTPGLPLPSATPRLSPPHPAPPQPAPPHQAAPHQGAPRPAASRKP